MTITNDTFAEIRAGLKNLPLWVKTKPTMRDLVHELAPDLRAAFEAGHYLSDLAEYLATRGIKISPSSLGSYLREEAKNSPKKHRASGAKPRAAI